MALIDGSFIYHDIIPDGKQDGIYISSAYPVAGFSFLVLFFNR